MTSRSIALVLAACLAAGFAAGAHARARQEKSSGEQASATPADPAQVRFSAEVERGQIYEHDVGHNLVFRLTPATSDEGGGWVIGMWPTAQPADEVIEFVEIATPPYHGYNQRYLAATAGYSSREAVRINPRRFNFVLSVHDQHVASEVVNAGLYPSAVSEADRPRIEAESAAVNLGYGELRILRSRVNTGKNGEPDTIAWVKFEVVLKFSAGQTLEQVLAPKVPSSR